MATFEVESQQRDVLREKLDALAEIDPQALVRGEELGTHLSFDEGLPTFKRTLGLFSDLASCDLEGVPHERLTAATQAADDALKRFQKIKEFTPQKTGNQSPIEARDHLIRSLQDEWERYWNVVTSIVPYKAQKALDLERLEREARGTLAELEGSAEDFSEKKEAALGEIGTALEEVRRAAGEAGVSQQAIHFSDEAEDRASEAKAWLAGAVGFAVLIAAYVLRWLEPGLADLTAEEPVGQVVAATLSKITILSLLTFGLVWCSRNFSRSRHNFVVNRHRRNALSTFKTFVSAASDPQVKDTVLIEAARSIFSPQASGYADAAQEPRAGGGIVEVLSRLTSGGES